MLSIYDLECLLAKDTISLKTSKERILKDPTNHHCVCFDRFLIKTMIKNVEDVTVLMNWRPRHIDAGDYIEKDCLYVPYEDFDLDNVMLVKEAVSDTAELRIPTFSIFNVTLLFVPKVGLHYEDIENGVEEFKTWFIALIDREIKKTKAEELTDTDKKQIELTKNLLHARDLITSLKEIVQNREYD